MTKQFMLMWEIQAIVGVDKKMGAHKKTRPNWQFSLVQKINKNRSVHIKKSQKPKKSQITKDLWFKTKKNQSELGTEVYILGKNQSVQFDSELNQTKPTRAHP